MLKALKYGHFNSYAGLKAFIEGGRGKHKAERSISGLQSTAVYRSMYGEDLSVHHYNTPIIRISPDDTLHVRIWHSVSTKKRFADMLGLSASYKIPYAFLWVGRMNYALPVRDGVHVTTRRDARLRPIFEASDIYAPPADITPEALAKRMAGIHTPDKCTVCKRKHAKIYTAVAIEHDQPVFSRMRTLCYDCAHDRMIKGLNASHD